MTYTRNTPHINSKQTLMKKKFFQAFKNDVKNVIEQERVNFDIQPRENTLIMDFTTDEYNYNFRAITFTAPLRSGYIVARIKKKDNPIYYKKGEHFFEPFSMFYDFDVEKGMVYMKNAVLDFIYMETMSFKQNSCQLCNDLDQECLTFRCYKRHIKNKGHLKNVAFRNKFFADTIADATKLNDDVCMLITSYLF